MLKFDSRSTRRLSDTRVRTGVMEGGWCVCGRRHRSRARVTWGGSEAEKVRQVVNDTVNQEVNQEVEQEVSGIAVSVCRHSGADP